MPVGTHRDPQLPLKASLQVIAKDAWETLAGYAFSDSVRPGADAGHPNSPTLLLRGMI
jgi:hypothetical protein